MRSRSTLALATALALGLGLAGCGADTGAARKTAAEVSSPAADWKPGGQGIARFGKDAKKQGTLWVVDGDDPTYLTGWDIIVKPGFEGNRCEQAARWLKRTGESFAGTPADSQEKATLENLVVACLNALKPLAAGGTSTTGFATWPAVDDDGYRFAAAIGATVTGSTVKVYVSVQVSPT